jgi:hypothetical protein
MHVGFTNLRFNQQPINEINLPLKRFLQHYDVLMPQSLEHPDLTVSGLLDHLVLICGLFEFLDCN